MSDGSQDNKALHEYSPDKVHVLRSGEDDEYGRNAFDQSKDEELRHALLPRHLAMISIGGVIGTGLFLGTGGALASAGPLGLWLGYLFMGSTCYSMMMCLGEVISWLPLPGGHIKLAERFVGKPFAFALGWLYFYNWVIVLPAELSAAAVLMTFWTDVNPAAFIAPFLILVVGINLAGTRVYGECEFWFASIKVITIVGLIILSICIDLGAGKQGRLGFRYWKDPGPFVQFASIGGSLGRFLGFFSVLIQAAFSYIGSEIVAIAAAEAKNPRKSVPSAIKKVWIRIVAFYVIGTFCIGLICPSNAPSLTEGHKTNRSPFVIAIKAAGIKGLPSVINAALITSALSAGSSDLYTSSRALYALALAGNAPRIFAKTNKRGLPIYSLAVSIAFSFLSFMSVKSGANTVFGWFVNMTANCGMLSWWCIALIHVRFRRSMAQQGVSRSTLPFTSPISAFAGPWVLFMTSVTMFFSGFALLLKANQPFDAASFFTNYVPLVIFLAAFGGALYYFGKQSMIKAQEVDLTTGLKEIQDEEYEEEPPRTLLARIWRVIS